MAAQRRDQCGFGILLAFALGVGIMVFVYSQYDHAHAEKAAAIPVPIKKTTSTEIGEQLTSLLAPMATEQGAGGDFFVWNIKKEICFVVQFSDKTIIPLDCATLFSLGEEATSDPPVRGMSL